MAKSRDDCETDFPAHDTRRCAQRNILEQHRVAIERIQDRLNEGDKLMTEHTIVLKQNTQAVERLTQAVEAGKDTAAKPNPLMSKVIDSAIAWIVPIALFCAMWLIVNSGAISGLAQKGTP